MAVQLLRLTSTVPFGNEVRYCDTVSSKLFTASTAVDNEVAECNIPLKSSFCCDIALFQNSTPEAEVMLAELNEA